jgi:hypothetical protein
MFAMAQLQALLVSHNEQSFPAKCAISMTFKHSLNSNITLEKPIMFVKYACVDASLKKNFTSIVFSILMN